jgi:hypothetical protein
MRRRPQHHGQNIRLLNIATCHHQITGTRNFMSRQLNTVWLQWWPHLKSNQHSKLAGINYG